MPFSVFNMKRVTGLFAASVVFYALLYALMPMSLLIEVLNGLFLGVAVAVIAVYSPLLMRAFKAKEFDRVSQFAVGITCIGISSVMNRAVNAFGRIFDAEYNILNSPWVGLSAFVAIIGGILFITAPGMESGKLAYNKKHVAWGLLAGSVVAAVMIYLQQVS